MQPGYEGHCKNVWDNCAKILYMKTDAELHPYVFELLKWLEDSNWPGYEIILERLLKYKDIKWLSHEVEVCVKMANALKNNKWLIDLSPILQNKELKEFLPNDVIEALENADFDD